MNSKQEKKRFQKCPSKLKVEKTIYQFIPSQGVLVLNIAQQAIFFYYLQLWPLIFLQSPDLQESKLPHIKDLIHTFLEPEIQGVWHDFQLYIQGVKVPSKHYRIQIDSELLSLTTYTCTYVICLIFSSRMLYVKLKKTKLMLETNPLKK